MWSCGSGSSQGSAALLQRSGKRWLHRIHTLMLCTARLPSGGCSDITTLRPPPPLAPVIFPKLWSHRTSMRTRTNPDARQAYVSTPKQSHTSATPEIAALYPTPLLFFAFFFLLFLLLLFLSLFSAPLARAARSRPVAMCGVEFMYQQVLRAGERAHTRRRGLVAPRARFDCFDFDFDFDSGERGVWALRLVRGSRRALTRAAIACLGRGGVALCGSTTAVEFRIGERCCRFRREHTHTHTHTPGLARVQPCCNASLTDPSGWWRCRSVSDGLWPRSRPPPRACRRETGGRRGRETAAETRRRPREQRNPASPWGATHVRFWQVDRQIRGEARPDETGARSAGRGQDPAAAGGIAMAPREWRAWWCWWWQQHRYAHCWLQPPTTAIQLSLLREAAMLDPGPQRDQLAPSRTVRTVRTVRTARGQRRRHLACCRRHPASHPSHCRFHRAARGGARGETTGEVAGRQPGVLCAFCFLLSAVCCLLLRSAVCCLLSAGAGSR